MAIDRAARGITVQTLNGETVIVQSGSFLACDENVTIDVGWQGFKSMFSGESLFWLKASGQGELALSSFGSIYEVTVEKDYTSTQATSSHSKKL